jgi:hypothetical protein
VAYLATTAAPHGAAVTAAATDWISADPQLRYDVKAKKTVWFGTA